MERKIKVAIFIDWYVPAFKAGGPIRSVANLVEQLKDQFDFYIFTSCYDLGGSEPIDVDQNQWIEVDGVRVKYFSDDNTSKQVFQSNLDLVEPDIVYINSMYSKKFAIWPLRLAKRNHYKIVLAPRGMLNPGALVIKKNKKRAFLTYANTMNWFKGVIWHATSEEEEQSIRKNMGQDVEVIQARNLPEVSEDASLRKMEKEVGKLRLVFLGRISKVKNLHGTLNLLKNWKFEKGEVVFDIYGPEEDGDYLKQCQRISSQIKNIEINFKGQIQSDLVKETLSNYHFLISSSTNENYGHAITEAFSVGLPVIISDQTPWRKLQEKEIGFDLPLDVENDWHYVFNKCLKMNSKDYSDRMKKSLEFYQKKIISGSDIDDHVTLFQKAYES